VSLIEETRLVHPGGRPSKAEQLLTPEMLEHVGKLLAEGHYQETVSDFLGIHRQTWWDWLQRGSREPGSIFEQFSDVVKKASAAAEIMLAQEIRYGADTWQSRAWIMERRFPKRWGKRLEITLREEAKRLAADLGVPEATVVAEAERIAAEMAARA
jgi:transposase